MAKKTYVGNGIEKFDGNLINITVNLSLVKLATEFIYKDKNGNSWIRLNVWKNKDGEDQWGRTHSVSIDDFKPTKKEEPVKEEPKSDDFPF